MKQKICLISPKFWDYVGGMETHAYEFARWFNDHPNYKITSIITKKKVPDGIPVASRVSPFKISIIKELTANFDDDLKVILNNSPENTDVYFFNSPNWIPIFKGLKEARPRSKIIVRSGGTDLVAGWIGNETDTTQNIFKNRKIISKAINDFVDVLIVNSNFSKERSLKIGIKENKIEVVLGGVDCDGFKPILREDGSSKIIVLHVSRFVKCKGVANSIEAFRKAMDKSGKEMELILVGDGPERPFLESIVKKFKLEDKIKFLGAKNIEAMPNYFNNSDLFLHLPITLKRKERGGEYEHVESMGRVFCEAAATGIPSIAFSVGGVPEVIEDKITGFLFKEGDIDGAAEKIYVLSMNNDLRREMGNSARKKALKEFDWKIIFNKYEKLFSK